MAEPVTESDESLVPRILGGAKRCYAIIVRRHQRAVFNLGLRMLRNRADAEDFAQEVFVKAYRGLPTFGEQGRFKSWLLGLAYRHGIDMLRRRRTTGEAEPEALLDPGPGPEAQGVAAGFRRAMDAAVGSLPPRFRLCMELFLMMDLSYHETSLVTGLPINTVKSHVFRAKKLLRRRLADWREPQ